MGEIDKMTDRDILITLMTKVDYLCKVVEHLAEGTSSSGGKAAPTPDVIKNAFDKMNKGIMDMQGVDDKSKEMFKNTLDQAAPLMSDFVKNAVMGSSKKMG